MTGASSRETILARIRAAVADAPEVPALVRDYRVAHVPDDPDLLAGLLADNLADYRARVHRTPSVQLPALIGEILQGARSLVVPPGLPPEWLTGTDAQRLADEPPLTARQLDAADAVITGCALAVAETGTIVLDAGPGQGRRALTLVPDVHVCVIRVPGQVVASLPPALERLDPVRPLTWIAGPSATSDIELARVEGVHGPRTLHAVLVTE